jgi:hypothetical protein
MRIWVKRFIFSKTHPHSSLSHEAALRISGRAIEDGVGSVHIIEYN